MVVCVLALVVFGVLAIFSASHRPLAKEAFDCVFRKITFRKCSTGLDKRLKSAITGKVMKKNKFVAGLLHKHFELLSWIFLILFFVSLFYTVQGGYNFYLDGNCNGRNEEGFCVFDPTGHNQGFSESDGLSCAANPPSPDNLNYEVLNLSLFPQSGKDKKNTVVFVGCYGCEYTREAYSDIIKLKDLDNVNFYYAHFPVKGSTEHLSTFLNCVSLIKGSQFAKANDLLFNSEVEVVSDYNLSKNLMLSLNINSEDFFTCINNEEILSLTKEQVENLNAVGVYGTPTVFINGEAVVGPKPYRVYKRLLNEKGFNLFQWASKIFGMTLNS